jgi:hypothetical protein
MKSHRRLPLLLLAAISLAVAMPLFATSYVMVDDRALVAQAVAVVDARIVSAEPAPTAGRPATDYTVQVERLLAGAPVGSTLVVRVPGGVRPDGLAFHVFGAPRFEPGERALLFLAPGRGGTYGILHLGLGAFHRVEGAGGGPPLALRDLSGAEEVVLPGTEADPRRHIARDYEAFAAWLADRASGSERLADYFVAEPPAEAASLLGKFTLFTVGGFHLRWFEFDTAGSVFWQAYSGGQPSVPGGGFTEVQTALAAWNVEVCTPVSLSYAGTTSATGGLASFDGVNVVLQDDPNDEIAGTFQCSVGGVLAIGGPWFDSSARAAWEGEEYVEIQGADVVMNDGIECLAASSPCFATYVEGVYAHELGHTLGLGHACGDSSSPSCASDPVLNDALMRAFAHDDCRGALLGEDDVLALWQLYDDGSACTGDLTLDLSSQTVDTQATFEACRTITAGGGFTVGSAGDVTLRAGERIALSDGFASEAGARLAVAIDPALRCQ